MHCDINGQIIASCWEAIADHWPNVHLDAFVVMPNHVHGILVITDDPMLQNVGAGFPRPFGLNASGVGEGKEGEGTSPLRQKMRKPTLGAVTAYYKYQSAKRINEARDTPGVPIWQRSYHDHIIHDDQMWNNARHYIANNPARWMRDVNNPARLPQP